MSDTPRTDSLLTWVSHARELERELNAVTSEVERLRKANLQLREGAEEQKQRIKRLEEAGDAMFPWSERVGQEYWTRAKEAKP